MKYNKIFFTFSITIVLCLLTVAIPIQPALASGTITVNPAKGPPGTAVTVNGQGFIPGDLIEIDFPAFESKGYTTVNPSGTFSLTFTVPDKRPGTYQVQAWIVTGGAGTLVTQRDFTITSSSEITINPNRGAVGTNIEISGTGFSAIEDITVKYDGGTVNVQSGDYRTDNNGKFKGTIITVPRSMAGYHAILVTGNTSGNNAIADFTVDPAITIVPTTGSPGTKITVTGTGFGPQKGATVYFNNVKLAVETTGRDGGFTTSFTVPVIGPGTYDVRAEDESNNRGTVRFSISAGISLNPTSGNIGSEVTVTGNGFKPTSPITITYATTPVATNTTDNGGAFSATFKVPPSTRGNHTITASDGTSNSGAVFNVLTSASLSLSTGYVGAPITISGTGFRGAVSIKYDDKEVTTVTADAGGSFSALFKVPISSAHVEHTITASAGSTSVRLPFTVESTPPPTPALVLPATNTKTKPEAQFDWSDVTAPSLPITYTLQIATSKDFTSSSIVFTKEGITKSEYTLTSEEKLKPAKEEAPYYWRVRAVDAASNEGPWSTPQSFYTASGFVFPDWTMWPLIGVGALALFILGFWLGRRMAYY